MPALLRHRLLTVVWLGLYLAATSASAPFHTHGEHGDAEHTCHHACGHAHGHDEGEHEPACAGVDQDHDHDCAVCRFIGQRTVPAEVGQLEHVSDLMHAVALAAPADPDAPLARTTHPRAPPQAG